MKKIMFAVFVIVLLNCSLVYAQEKKKPTFGNDDFGTPEKNPSPSSTTASTYKAPKLGVDDDPESAKFRKALLNLDGSDWKKAQTDLVNKFFEAQSKGESVSYFFFHPDFSSKLFAVRSWQIVDQSLTEKFGTFTVRVDSSNKGGSQITVLWKVYTCLSKFNDYALFSMKEADK